MALVCDWRVMAYIGVNDNNKLDKKFPELIL